MQQPSDDPKSILIEFFDVAVAAAQADKVLEKYLPKDRDRKVIVIGAGKAAAAMAANLERHWPGPLSGIVITPYNHQLPCKRIEIVEASHPVPDELGVSTAKRIVKLVENLTAEDLVICLISGGGSSLLTLPAPALSLNDKQAINKALLKSAATIAEINCVRKHLSAIKGGRLALHCYPATVLSFAISDVPGDDPAVIASGPTVADESTSSLALSILNKYSISIPKNISDWLQDPGSETVKPNDPRLDNCHYQIIAAPKQSLQAAARRAEDFGITPLILGDDIEGESRQVATIHAAIARSIADRTHPIAPPCLLLSGGETTVTLRGSGRGGRNTEYLLGLAVALRGTANIYALAADTDGIDGSGDNAGALLSPDSWHRAIEAGIDAKVMLDNNDAYSFFENLDDLLITGPTRTNVNDFRAILILPENQQHQQLW